MKNIKTIFAVIFVLLIAPGIIHAQDSSELPLVKIIATGGTIANSPDGRMGVENILEQLPRIATIAEIDVYDYNRIGSSQVSLQNWIDIAHIITRELENNPDIAGVVVTHGSNTSEETAYFLNLVLDTNRPVVVVGAQRQRNTLSEDGSRNFYDAVRVASHKDAGGRGVMLIANEMIHPARDVTKTISYRTETWDSGDLGVLGFTDMDMVRFYRRPTTRHTFASEFGVDDIERSAQLPRVDIIYSYADAGPELVQAAIDTGTKGIIVAGFPTGSATPAMDTALLRAINVGIPVVMSHRGGKGRVQTGREFISADNLTPQKARILLMVALANGIAIDRLQEVFLNY